MVLLQMLAGRAAIGISLGTIDEHYLGPKATRRSWWRIGLGNHWDNAGRGIGADLLALIVPTIGKSDHP